MRRITDQAGTVIWRWDSKPFGESVPVEDPDGVAFTFNLRFPGQRYDADTGLHYNYFRDYEPGVGRYIESDAIGLHGGLNLITYGSNQPTQVTDNLGLINSTIANRPPWAPPAEYPETLSECQSEKRTNIIRKCLPLLNVTEKIACISAWRAWEKNVPEKGRALKMNSVAYNFSIPRKRNLVALALSLAMVALISYAVGKHDAIVEANERKYSEEFANTEFKLEILSLLQRGKEQRAKAALFSSTSAHLENLEQHLTIQDEVTIFNVMRAELLGPGTKQYVLNPPTTAGLEELRRRVESVETP